MDSTAWSAIGAIGTWFTAAIYIVILIYAVKQVNEAKNLRTSQIRPFVVIDIEPGFMLYLVITNIGSTLARDVKITFAPELKSSVDENLTSDTPLLTDGIPNLPPSRTHRIFFDALMYRSRRDDLPTSYDVKVEYKEDNERRHCEHYVLDLRSLYNTAPPPAGVPELVEALKNLNNTVKHWTDGSKGLLVHSRDKDEMLRERRERYESRLATDPTVVGDGQNEPTDNGDTRRNEDSSQSGGEKIGKDSPASDWS